MSERFTRERRLCRREDFQRTYARGTAYSTQWFVCHVYDSGERDRPSRLGITAPRQIGRAHDRNRYKRWAREVFRREKLRAGLDVVVSFRPAIASADFDRFRSALLDIFRRAELCEQ